MKHLFTLLTLIILLPMAAIADEFGKCGENLTFRFEETTGTLTIFGQGGMWNTVEEYQKFPESWALCKERMEKLVVEDGVTSICDGTFSECRLLMSVVLPNSITTMGVNIFFRCPELTSVILPDNLEVIPPGLFYSCTKLSSVSIPESVKVISSSAFTGCTSLTAISIPEGVTSIESNAFNGCSRLNSIFIPRKVVSIGSGVFSGCSDLASIQVENGNPIFDSRQNCNAIIETNKDKLIVGCKNSTFPNDITSIGDFAFSGCAELESILLPASIQNIGKGAFQRCSKLKSINVPQSVLW